MAKKENTQNIDIKLIVKDGQIIEASYKFNIWEMRLFLSVIAQINNTKKYSNSYTIWYKDIIKTFQLTSAQSYGFLREATQKLSSKLLIVKNLSNNSSRETTYLFIKILPNDSTDHFEFSIDAEIKDLLFQLGNIYRNEKGALDFSPIIKLGVNAIRIYELLRQQQQFKYATLNIEALKEKLGLTDVYPLFGNFFQKVIAPSVKAINKYSDLEIFEIEKVKTGRAVTSLIFRFKVSR